MFASNKDILRHLTSKEPLSYFNTHNVCMSNSRKTQWVVYLVYSACVELCDLQVLNEKRNSFILFEELHFPNWNGLVSRYNRNCWFHSTESYTFCIHYFFVLFIYVCTEHLKIFFLFSNFVSFQSADSTFIL